MELLAWAFSSGWASGINGYAVVLVMGLMGRFGGADGVPEIFERPDVLLVATALLLIDAVMDKIPYLDSAWDAAHTMIRPVIGAVIALMLAGDATSLEQAIATATGGGAALASHLVKSGLRVAVNTSPEPASNIAVSLAEDFTVAGVVAVSVLWPLVAACIAGALLVSGLLMVRFLLRRLALSWRALRSRQMMSVPHRFPADPGPPPRDAA
ncbi:MAG: hypothetical protein QG608_1177 [Actinomycetota bacterium]|nr:hypothetical protein [Actinomycetota bacterium]